MPNAAALLRSRLPQSDQHSAVGGREKSKGRPGLLPNLHRQYARTRPLTEALVQPEIAPRPCEELLKRNRRNHEQINRRNPPHMIAKEGLPNLQWPIPR